MTENSTWPVLCRLVQRLREENSWTGETHIQKTAFALERLAGLNWPMGFIIYKYGPFSFRLKEQLGELRAWGMLALDYELGGYGPRHRLTDKGIELSRSAQVDAEALEYVVNQMGHMSVKDLEKIATGLFLLTEPLNAGASEEKLQTQLQSCKPHLSPEEIEASFRDARKLLLFRNQLA